MWIVEGHVGPRQMRVSHRSADMSALYDDVKHVSCMGLAFRAGLADLVADTLSGDGAANATLKVVVIAADTMDDRDVLRGGGLAQCGPRPGDARELCETVPKRHGATLSFRRHASRMCSRATPWSARTRCTRTPIG
jgi:hypothetical protein